MDSVIRVLKRHEFKFFVAIVTVSVVLGLLGFYQAYILRPHEEDWNHWDVVYSTLRMFALDTEAMGGSTGKFNVLIHIARLLAPVVLIWALVRAGLTLWEAEQANRRLMALDHHTILVGRSALARSLRRELSSRDDDLPQATVLVLVNEAKEARQVGLEDQGICTLAGDALEDSTWNAGRLESARQIFLLCDDDAENEALAHFLLDRFEKTPPERPLDIYVALSERLSVHVDDTLLARQTDQLMVHLVAPLQVAARHFFSLHPVHQQRLPRAGDRPIHLLLLGYSEFGQHLLSQAIRVGHYLGGARPRLTVVDDENNRDWRRFMQRTPGLDLVADVTYLNEDPGGLTAEQWSSLQESGAFDSVYIALEDRTEAIILAARTSRWFPSGNRPVYLCVTHDIGMNPSKDLSFEVYCPQESFSFDCMSRASLDEEAKQFHAHYHQKYPDLGPWRTLNELNRNANRDAADHGSVVEAILSCEGLNWSDVTPGSEIEEQLAALENRRWMASKVMAGFEYGPTKDNNLKRHPLLVDYDTLPDAEREKDRENVRLRRKLRGQRES